MTTHELVELLTHAWDGDPWHGPSFKSVLSKVRTAEAAAARPLTGRHSIWELVLHATAWTREVERRVGGAAPAAEPTEGDWPSAPPPARATQAAWLEAVKHLEDAHQSLMATVTKAGDQRWDEIVGAQRDPAAGTGYSYGVMVVGLVAHHAYHSGQIALLTPTPHVVG
jgi:hypothetical protein